ncbi:monovalent cation/H(+) antiporter subunit G [Spiractinospora alimapuensis]|uniref:monovalent cation/H(+) antiporter subunit G n=1 Tax=Spiractinospora alimapuensis TaxID=2820884 RepID=UPI001EEC8205|nr:monovalent cation/H(+) antiporter subunit G [Spiractinospora alimapuensis]QVQ50688.1 monovalent cation/H(+) antiporter subunit G [Spiractinospora alimapuensis]
MTLLNVLAGVAIGFGTAFMVTSAIALIRLDDVFTRINAVTKAATLGVILILIGSFLMMPGWDTAWKVVLAVLLQLITSPVGSFFVARAAYRSRSALSSSTCRDELGGRVPDGTE